jgi:general secretion pathway protein C
MLNHNPRMPRFSLRSDLLAAHAPAGAAFVVWALVAFSAVSWGLKASVAGTGPAVAAAATSTEMIQPQSVARSLGAEVAATAKPTTASRFQLQGVLAGEGQGVALLVVDGKAAKPYRVGATVADGWVVQSAQGRRVTLGPSADAPAALTLELPAKK